MCVYPLLCKNICMRFIHIPWFHENLFSRPVAELAALVRELRHLWSNPDGGPSRTAQTRNSSPFSDTLSLPSSSGWRNWWIDLSDFGLVQATGGVLLEQIEPLSGGRGDFQYFLTGGFSQPSGKV